MSNVGFCWIMFLYQPVLAYILAKPFIFNLRYVCAVLIQYNIISL